MLFQKTTAKPLCRPLLIWWQRWDFVCSLTFFLFTVWNLSIPFLTIILKESQISINVDDYLHLLHREFSSPKLNPYLCHHSQAGIESAVVCYPHFSVFIHMIMWICGSSKSKIFFSWAERGRPSIVSLRFIILDHF